MWTGAHAWVMCLWATAAHRALAESLARPSRLPLAKGAAYLAAGITQRQPAPPAEDGRALHRRLLRPLPWVTP